MTRITMLLATALAAIVVFAAEPATVAARAATPGPCTRSQLSVRSNGSQGALGTIYGAWVFTNVSKATCTVRGYPALQLYGKRGRPIPTHVKRDLRPRPRTVTLKPGASATFRTSYNDVAVPRCPVSSVIQITPPHAAASLFIPAVLTPCRGIVHESAVFAGIHHA